MILMDEMVPLRLYSSKLRAYIPFNPANKKKGAMITLLTNGVDDSIQLINMPYIHNPNYFISYYLNRNVKYFLTKNGNVTIEDEDEDEGEEAVQEAVLHTFKPSNPQFDSEGSSHDLKLLSDNFAKKKFDKWYDYFRIKKEKRIYPTVYGFNTLASMAKAINDKAIMDDGKLILNSYNTAMEIFVLNSSEYNIKNADGPYEMYCENAIITYVVDTQFKNASWYLANQVGTALSGAADYLYQKNNFKTDDKLSAAIMISRFEKEYGRSEIIDLCRTGNYTKLAKLGARDFIARVKPIFQKPKHETAIQESDGTHGDVMRVYKAMNATDQRFISSDGSYQTASDNNVCYRHIEREGFLTTKGFVECFRDFDDIASVVIGVHPKFRGEGLASKMMEQMLKEFPKENPDINELVWRADAKNKKSRKLAEKFGFKLIRESNIQAVYRYEFKPSHKYDDIPDEILSDKDLIKWVKKNLSLDTSYVTKSTKLMSIKDIIHKKNVRQVDVAYFCYKAIQKMSLDCVFCLYTEHSDENSMQVNFGDIHAAVVYWYTPDTLILMDPLNDALKLGYGVIKRDAMLEYQIKLHEAYKWGDINTYPYIIEYVPFDADIQPGKLIYKDIFKIDTLAQKASLRKYSLLEFSTTSKLSPPEMRNNQIQMNLQRLIKVKIDDEVIEKYGTLMPGLHHLRTTNNCTGYLFLDPNSKPKKDRPVCYYNVQRKKDENYGEVVWLQGIEVDEDYQGRGLAKQLLQMAIANDGVTNLAVNKNNEVAYRLYTSMGFRQYNINGSMINMQLPKKKLKEVHIDHTDDNMLMFENQVVIFTEALSQKSYDQRLKQYLFKQRLRNSSMQISLYNQVKDACPVIRKAFVSPAMYNGLNLFVDLGYYNKLFLQNNTTVKDIAIQFYWDFVNRLIDNAIEPEYRSRYSKNTIFIPVWSNAWPVQPNSYVYDWKVNLNPISMIFRMLRRNPAELKNKWGKLDVVFIGKTGYFKVNFKSFELKNLTRFKVRLEKLWRGESIDRDPDEDGYQYGSSELSADRDSTSAIAVKVIDKIEDSTGIEVNNVTSAITTNDASAMPKVDGSADPVIFPNMRIRNTTINTRGVCSIGILAPSEDNIVDTISHNDVLRLAYTSHLDYFSL